MLAAERMAKIVEITNRQGVVTVDELLDELGGSKATVRRDINRLCDNGAILKTHGGAMSIAMGSASEPPLRVKSTLHVEEKRRIGRAALRHIQEDEFVIIDSGTTTLEMARQLDERKRFTAVTNDLLVAMEVAKRPIIDLVMVGGVLRKEFYSFYGCFAEDTLKNIAAGKVFLSVDAVDPDFGLMNYTVAELAVKKLLIETCRQVILLCDHSKFTARSFLRICGIDRVDRIITGVEADADTLSRLRDAGIEVETV